jgi:hypothetical protein
MADEPLVDRLFPPHRPWWRPVIQGAAFLAVALTLLFRSVRHLRSFAWPFGVLLGGLAALQFVNALRSRPTDSSWGPDARWDGDGEARNEWASTSLALGVGGWLLDGALGILPAGALLFGLVALRQIRRGDGRGKGLAVAGIVLGVIGLVAAGLSYVFPDEAPGLHLARGPGVAGALADLEDVAFGVGEVAPEAARSRVPFDLG